MSRCPLPGTMPHTYPTAVVKPCIPAPSPRSHRVLRAAAAVVATQVQPADTACHAYNMVLAAIQNRTQPYCTWVVSGYYGGYCDCGNNYACSGIFTKQCRLSSYGSLSKADCEASCGSDSGSHGEGSVEGGA